MFERRKVMMSPGRTVVRHFPIEGLLHFVAFPRRRCRFPGWGEGEVATSRFQTVCFLVDFAPGEGQRRLYSVEYPAKEKEENWATLRVWLSDFGNLWPVWELVFGRMPDPGGQGTKSPERSFSGTFLQVTHSEIRWFGTQVPLHFLEALQAIFIHGPHHQEGASCPKRICICIWSVGRQWDTRCASFPRFLSN